MVSSHEGFNKSFHLQLFTDSRFHRSDKRYRFNNPNWHISYKEPGSNLDQYENRVIDLLQRSVTHELFGLSYWDLMNMDLPTFNKIRNRILDICQKQDEMKNQLDKEQKKLETAFQKGY
mgnify:CR=1 FL=1|nr:MAG TPA: hypothetical protein [Bacteriophage sp.]